MTLESLLSTGNSLSAAERRVADIVLETPSEVTRMSTRELAERAKVSEPTVIRLCRSVGCDGFTDFKLKLAESLVERPITPIADVESNDGPSEVVAKTFAGAERALRMAHDFLDVTSLEKAASIIAKSTSIWFFGYGASGIVATDARHKFLHLGIPCGSEQDLHNQLVIASGAGPGTTVVIISHTGRSSDLLQVIDGVHQSGGSTVAVTQANSPVADQCGVVIDAREHEDASIYTPTKSRLVQLTLIDSLAALIALYQSDQFVNRQRVIKDSLVWVRTTKPKRTRSV